MYLIQKFWNSKKLLIFWEKKRLEENWNRIWGRHAKVSPQQQQCDDGGKQFHATTKLKRRFINRESKSMNQKDAAFKRAGKGVMKTTFLTEGKFYDS